MTQLTRRLVIVFALCAVLLLAASLAAGQGDNPFNYPLELLTPEVLDVRPHDTSAYTQGLLLYDGLLYESTGNGTGTITTLREVDPATGEVLRQLDIGTDVFGEGLTRVGDQLIQITWQSHVAFVYDLATFEQVGEFEYEGEGWGLCTDGDYLVMSDGTEFLQIRDAETFDLIMRAVVTIQGMPLSQFTVQSRPLSRLNELECVSDAVYANVWQTDYILRIDRMTGVVTGVIDATGLLTEEERAGFNAQQVLNGIVYLPESDTFLITGKEWPHMYEVRFVVQEDAPAE
ncbi:MAG: glutaminyl-peptide cyclotransferase [Anaerolineae bacterium]|nr:glutaminyl-peptide cyclotransferase [Anaerolineae bacterium]